MSSLHTHDIEHSAVDIEYELQLCPIHGTMTNHLHGHCMKGGCKPTPTNVTGEALRDILYSTNKFNAATQKAVDEVDVVVAAIQALYAGDIQEPSSSNPSPSKGLAELHENVYLRDGEPINKDKGGDDE